jgi:hypothetical protein
LAATFNGEGPQLPKGFFALNRIPALDLVQSRGDQVVFVWRVFLAEVARQDIVIYRPIEKLVRIGRPPDFTSSSTTFSSSGFSVTSIDTPSPPIIYEVTLLCDWHVGDPNGLTRTNTR